MAMSKLSHALNCETIHLDSLVCQCVHVSLEVVENVCFISVGNFLGNHY